VTSKILLLHSLSLSWTQFIFMIPSLLNNCPHTPLQIILCLLLSLIIWKLWKWSAKLFCLAALIPTQLSYLFQNFWTILQLINKCSNVYSWHRHNGHNKFPSYIPCSPKFILVGNLSKNNVTLTPLVDYSHLTPG